MNNLEDLKKQYKELIDKCEELGNEIEKLENGEKQKKGRWRIKYNDEYYYINGIGDVDSTSEYYIKVDDWAYKTRNYFKTEEEAKNCLEKINTYYDLMDLAEELNEGEEIDWKNSEQKKYFIELDEGDISQDWYDVTKFLGSIYCLNPNFIEIAIERIGEDKLIKLFKED